MAIGDFSKADDAEIIGGDYSGAAFGTVEKSKHKYVCAIRNKGKTIILDEMEVEYFASLTTKGLSKGSSRLIEATVHGVLSTVIPGGGVIGNTAAAAAGVASRSAATHAVGGIREYRDILIAFRDGKTILVRCVDKYVKIMNKNCLKLKLSKEEIKYILGNENDSSPSQKVLRGHSKGSHLSCRICHERISASDKFCPHCGARINGDNNERIYFKGSPDGAKKRKKKRVLKVLLVVGIILILILILIYIFSPPQQVIDYRLNKILDTCSNNELSSSCKSLQNRYKIRFKYCYAYYDIPEIDKSIPVYAVAEREAFKSSPLMNSTLKYEIDGGYGEISPYYGCVSNYSDLGRNIGDVSNEEIEDLQASYWLKNRPWVSFNPSLCQVSYEGFESTLWNNIPNFKDTIYSAKKEIESRSSYCYMKDNPRLAELFNSTDDKLRKYSENNIVREYYYGFDSWNMNYNRLNFSSCVYGKDSSNEKRFVGNCLTDVGEKGYPLSGFVDFMKERKGSNYYTSRLIK